MTKINDSLFENQVSDKSLFGATCLITGTCIGAGMLALPFVTSFSGFYPSLIIGCLCWLFMLATGLLFLEAVLWLPDGANVLSISKRFLGPIGEWIAGFFFLFLYYCLLVSYIDEGAPLLNIILKKISNVEMDANVIIVFFTLIFFVLVLWGTKLVSRVNWVLVTGLIVSYLLLIIYGSGSVKEANLSRQNWSMWMFAAPTLFSAYGYHNIIPTLSTYLERDAKKLRLAIIIGSSIPFVIYTLWQWIVMGSISPEDLTMATTSNLRSYEILELITDSPWVGLLGVYFALFALVTSLLGVSLSMIDFLGDGFQSKRSGWPRFWLSLMVFIPPLCIAFYHPGIFIQAIGIAGGFGEAILNGLLPISVVWIGRYKMGLTSEVKLPGGRVLLWILLLFTVMIMGLECKNLIS